MPLYMQAFGPVEAPAILFIHDVSLGSWMWKSQIEELQTDYHLLVPDLPEHGQSSHISPLTIRDTTNWLAEIVQNHTQTKRAHVVATGIGGLIAIDLLCQASEVVDRAILNGVMVRPVLKRWTENLFVKAIWPFKNRSRFIRWSMEANGIPNEDLNLYSADVRAFTRERYDRLDAEISNFRPLPKLGSINNPTLVTFAAREYSLMFESAKDLVSALPHATGRMVLNAKRCWNLQMPEVFARMVRTWITNEALPKELRPYDEIESIVLRRRA